MEMFMREILQEIKQVIDNVDITIISYVDEEGYPISKAMLKPRNVEDFKVFWFSTNTSSNKVKSFRNNSKASIYFFDKSTFKGVSIQGNVEVIDTKSVKESIWQEGDLLYYSKGVEDPDYCVLKFVVDKCRYYSDFKSIDINIKDM